MSKHIRSATSGMRSALFLTVLGCLLVAGLVFVVSEPASAARFGAPQNSVLQIQEWSAPAPAAESQEPLHGTPLEGGSALELRDGRLSCRAVTDAEARAMRRDPGPSLHVIREEAFALGAPNAPEQAQPGLKIILRGTPQLDGSPEAKAAFLRAARAWESLIQNPITVVIDVDFGPTNFGEPFGEDQYGLTRFQRAFEANAYSIIRSALIRSAGSPQEAALYNALPPAQLPTDLGAATGMIYHVPAMRALGLFPPVADPDAERETLGLPPAIGFNSAISFDFDPSDGIKPKRLNFNASAMHEIGHALGFFSGVGIKELHPDIPLTPDVLDLFRFRPGVTLATFATAPRILSSGGEHIFFDGGPELAFATGRPDYTGGDGEQAGHWKHYYFTGRYIGIMDPGFYAGLSYRMAAHDLAAFERIGYRTNPLPNPREAELKPDDGTLDTRVWGNGVIVVNRLTPPGYPATLRKLRILVPPLSNQPDPAGKPITLLIGAQSNSSGQMPQFTRIETTVPSISPDLFLEFTIPNGPTINAGDFYVGYQAPSPNQGVGFAIDTNGSPANRTFYSENNGSSFASLSEALQGRAANAMIRALVSIPGPAPTPLPTPIPVPTPQPGPATVALTSGVPQDEHLDRSSPTGSVFNETQYTIQAPSGATQLKIDLNANTDLDLYARFGSRVVFQNGNPVADFKSVSDNYHESITITPESSPALRAGIYYFMVVNYGPGPSTFKITATVTGGSTPSQGKAVSVSAASFNGDALASEAIVAAFGARLATTVLVAPGTPDCPTCLSTELAGTKVTVKDSVGTERPAPLFFVSPSQVNYLIPEGTAAGAATVTVTSGDGTVSAGTARIAAVAPGLFTANGDGQGVPAAVALRVKPGEDPGFEPIAQYDSAQRRFVPRPLDLGTTTDEVFLVLFGTGLRNRQALSTVSINIGGVEAPALYAGPGINLAGLDQINVRLPRSLMGRGEVDVMLIVDGKTANTVKINIR